MKVTNEQFVNFDDVAFIERKKLVECLLPPIKDRIPNSLPDLKMLLFNYWSYTINEYMIDHEYRYCYPSMDNAYDNQDPWEDEVDEIRRAMLNCERWLAKARTSFEASTKILYATVATDSDYLKHYPNIKWDVQLVQKKSKQRALLGTHIKSKDLDKIYCEILEQKAPELIIGDLKEIIVQTNNLVGYSNGERCYHLLFKLAPEMFHAYPITVAEVNQKTINYDIKYWPQFISRFSDDGELDSVSRTNLVLSQLY